MGLTIDVNPQALLREIRGDAMAEGEASGIATFVQGMITSRFGAVPDWAMARLGQASALQLQGCQRSAPFRQHRIAVGNA